MRTDARIKQAFPLILISMITLGAYAQARGLAHLFGAHLRAAMAPVKGRSQEKNPERITSAERTGDGHAILARNPFDSITGPLDASQDPDSTREILQANNANPYADPICESLRVLLITTTDDPTWSFAAIAMGREKASLRRVGDTVGQHMVLAMAWDRVWMHSGASRCQSKLHGELAMTKPIQPPNIGVQKSNVPPAIADKIRHIADHRYEVDRSIIEDVMAKHRDLLGSLRVTLAKESEGPGLKLRGIRPNSLLGSLGILDGDVLQSINGFEMTDPMVAMQAYPRLLTADKLDVRVKRAGKPIVLDVSMR
jgi:general secretion pathway protein C